MPWKRSKWVKGQTGSQQGRVASGNTSVAPLKVTAKSPNWNYKFANEVRSGQRILQGEIRINSRARTGLYAETYLITATGPLQGQPKVAWLNFYDFELVEDKGNTMIIRISERMAKERSLTK